MKILDLFRKKRAPSTTKTSLKPLPAGSPAPHFNLLSDSDQLVSSVDFLGKPLILVFYPADDSPVCSSQLALYNQVLPLFQEHDARLAGVSVDDPQRHRAFAEKLNLSFPLLADNAPPGAIAQAYGVFDQQAGTSGRALFVIDAEGIIRWSYLSPSSVNPGANGILEALERLSLQNPISGGGEA
jgi:peroxiredoxin